MVCSSEGRVSSTGGEQGRLPAPAAAGVDGGVNCVSTIACPAPRTSAVQDAAAGLAPQRNSSAPKAPDRESTSTASRPASESRLNVEAEALVPSRRTQNEAGRTPRAFLDVATRPPQRGPPFRLTSSPGPIRFRYGGPFLLELPLDLARLRPGALVRAGYIALLLLGRSARYGKRSQWTGISAERVNRSPKCRITPGGGPIGPAEHLAHAGRHRLGPVGSASPRLSGSADVGQGVSDRPAHTRIRSNGPTVQLGERS